MAGRQMTDHAQTIAPTKRLYLIDYARGWAIIAMAIFHFTWDLEFFGFVEPGLTSTFEWKTFARCIASSFLFLAGISLILGHDPVVRVKSFINRMIWLVSAAAVISAATFYAMPNAPIFFGILHSIAAASIIGLSLRKLPPVLLVLLAVLVFLAPFYLRSEIFDTPILWWVGLNANIPRSNDYVPILPWLAPFLIGMAVAKHSKTKGWFTELSDRQSPPNNIFYKTLSFVGRHSLATYLLHQPILLGLVWLAAQILN
ncbi:MAG: heparan-alpha-glucosaminide N-acetyltransferase [Lentilitoribacter sp.]